MTAVAGIKTLLRNEIVRVLQQDIPFQVQASDINANILPAAVVIQKTRAQRNRQDIQENQLMDLPGLIVCSPLRTPVPPTEGTNERDWWHYFFLIQLVDRDLWSNTDRLGTWDKWVEQIISAFMFKCFDTVVTLPAAQTITTCASGVQDIDETRWVREDTFISGVTLEIRMMQPRGIIA